MIQQLKIRRQYTQTRYVGKGTSLGYEVNMYWVDKKVVSVPLKL